MNRWKRSFVHVVQLFVIMVLISGLVSAETVLTVLDPSAGSDNNQFAYFPEIIPMFEAANPGVRVELIHAGMWGEINERIPLLAAAGELPDVVFSYNRTRTSFIRMGIFQDLTPFIESDPDVVEGLIPPVRESLMYQGRYWAMPHYWFLRLANINLTAFEEAGLPHPHSMYLDDQWDFDLMPEIGPMLTVRDAEDNLEQIGIYTHEGDLSSPWVWGMGEDIFSADGTEVYLDRPGVRRGYEFLVDLVQGPGAQLNITPGINWSEFVNGQWAIAIWNQLMYHVQIAWNLPFEYEYLPFPAGPVSDATNLTLVRTWSIASSSQNSRLAWEFIKFLTGVELDQMRIERRFNLPLHTQNIDYAVDAFAQSGIDFSLVLRDIGVRGKPAGSPVDMRIMQELHSHMNPVYLGEESLGQALDNAQRTISLLLQGIH